MVSLYSAAGIHPEVPQAVLLSLLCAELNLVKSSLVTSTTSSELVESDFLVATQPCVREYSVGRYVAGAHQVLREQDRAIMSNLE